MSSHIFILYICFLAYCVYYAVKLRRAPVIADIPAGCGGFPFDIERGGTYSVWLCAPSVPDKNPPFAITDREGKKQSLLPNLFHADFARSKRRHIMLRYGRLKKGAYSFEHRGADTARFLIKKTAPEWPLILFVLIMILADFPA